MKKIIKIGSFVLCLIAVAVVIVNVNKTIKGQNKTNNDGSNIDLYMSIKAVDELPDDAVYETANVKLSDGRRSYYYNALDSNQKKLFDQIDSGIVTYPTNAVTISPGVNLYQMGEAKIVDAIWSWFYANPDVYWITSSVSYTYNSSSGDVTALYFGSYECDVEAFNNKVQSIVDEVNSSCSTNYEKLHLIQQLVCENTEYDYNFNNIQYNQTTYSAIVSGYTVCAGYGRACNLIANRCNIEGVESVVTAEHLFNYYIEGNKSYLFDACWDDANPVRWNYFLIGADTLHQIDSSTHHTALIYDVFPSLSRDDLCNSLEEPETTSLEETTPYEEPIAEEPTTEELTTPYVEPTTEEPTTEEPTTPYIEPTTEEPTTPYVEPTTEEPTTPYVEPTTEESTTPYVEPTTEEPTTPYEKPTEEESELAFVTNRSQSEIDRIRDKNQIALSINDPNEIAGKPWLVFGMGYSYVTPINKSEIEWFSDDEGVAVWDKEFGFFLDAKEDGTTIVGVRAYIDGKLRSDHVLVTVKDGRFVTALYEKH